MSNSLSMRARRAGAVWSLAAFLAIGLCASARASRVSETDDFADIASAALEYADQVGAEHVLVVLDIDNTLLAMNDPLGSDQWFEWQRYLQQHEPTSRFLVADSLEGLLKVQGVLYEHGQMHPPQRNLPGIIRRLQERGVRTLVLTSRGDEFRAATERELSRNGYDFAASALPVDGVPSGRFLPYDLKNPAENGLTQNEVSSFRLSQPRPISYERGIMMTAGQNKGAMLLSILHQSTMDVRAIVYADDHLRHVSAVHAAMLGRGVEITSFAYTREDANVKRFQYGSKQDVFCRWRELCCKLETVRQ